MNQEISEPFLNKIDDSKDFFFSCCRFVYAAQNIRPYQIEAMIKKYQNKPQGEIGTCYLISLLFPAHLPNPLLCSLVQPSVGVYSCRQADSREPVCE